MGLLDLLLGYHRRCPACNRHSAKRNAAGQWLCSGDTCRNYYRKDLVRRIGRAVAREAAQRVPPVADALSRRLTADNAAELARLSATLERKAGTSSASPESMNVAAWVVLSQLPPELLNAPLEQLVTRHGKRSDFVFRFARQEILEAIKTGKLEFSVGDVLRRFPHQVFTDAAGRLRDRRITIPLEQITSRVPATWLNRAPVAVAAPSAPKPPALPAGRTAAPSASPRAERTASRAPAGAQQGSPHVGCVIGVVGLAVASHAMGWWGPLRVVLTIIAVVSVFGWIQSQNANRGR